MKKLIIIIYIALLMNCKELPIPDILTGTIPVEIIIEEPSQDSVYETGTETVIRWTNSPGITGDLKIELLDGNKTVKVLTEKEKNKGEFNWKNNEPMRGGYRIRLTIANGVFTGESWDSDEFIIKKSWQDLGFVSTDNAWGASIVMSEDSKPIVMYQEPNGCISLKQYNLTGWTDLEIENNEETYLSSYFSQSISNSGDLLAFYGKDVDHTIVKRWKFDEKRWEFYAYLTAGQMAFGVSAAVKSQGDTIVSFATMVNEDLTNPNTSNFCVYLRTRVDNGHQWEDLPWKMDDNKKSWRDEGTIALPNISFGHGILELNHSYWLEKIILPIITAASLTSNKPIETFLIENKDIITGLQSDLYTSLALDANDTPYIAYVDGSNTGRGVFVTKKNGNDWEQVGDVVSKGNCNMVSLSIMPGTNQPVVAYNVLNDEKTTVVKSYNGSGWQDLGFTGSSKGTHPSLSVDDRGRIIVASGRWVKVLDGGEWKNVGVPVNEGGGFHPQWMTINSTHIAVAYVDGEHNNRIRVKMQPLD